MSGSNTHGPCTSRYDIDERPKDGILIESLSRSLQGFRKFDQTKAAWLFLDQSERVCQESRIYSVTGRCAYYYPRSRERGTIQSLRPSVCLSVHLSPHQNLI